MREKQHSMKWKILRILLICWLIPIFFLLGVFGLYVGSNHRDMTVQNYKNQLEFNNQICLERLNRAVEESRKASYDGRILNIRANYLSGSTAYDIAQKGYTDYLMSAYQKSDVVLCAMLCMKGEDEQISSVYNESVGGSYQQIRNFWQFDYPQIEEYTENLGTSVGFMVCDNNVYLVRNMVDSHFQTQGVLTLLINQDYCMGSLVNNPMHESVLLRIDNTVLGYENGEFQTEVWKEWESISESLENTDDKWIRGQLYLKDSQQGKGYRLCTYIRVERSVTMFPFFGYPYIITGMGLSLVLMLVAILRVFKREVTTPVVWLSDGLERIEKGDLGYQIDENIKNKEFQYLTDSVNKMSKHLESQILKSYQEELALREARIMALQSHINPHFLNNTMETINWEARLEGNEKVSKMIEALSTMLDAAMDRHKKPEVLLEEELGYVNSYLYIMRERLGKKMHIEMQIPESLYQYMVPRLILQPVIENAIEHGVIQRGGGTVEIRGHSDDTYLYLEVENDGEMTNEDKARIKRLLEPEYNTSKEPAGNLGIANVNQRLRILSGTPCGLNIFEQNGHVIAVLTIKKRTNNTL